MQTRYDAPKRTEIANSDPENLILIEDWGDHILIRAAHDSFSQRHKEFFVWHLIAEGFISDGYEMSWERGKFISNKIFWEVDDTWALTCENNPRTSAFMRKLILVALLFWVALIALLFNGAMH